MRVSRHRASTSPVAVRARRGGGGAPCPEVTALLAAPKSPLLLPYLASYRREGREHLVRPMPPCSLAEVRDFLTPRLVALVVEEVVEGLALLHAAGLVHGSLSAATVFVARGGQVRLGDWGLGDMVEPAASRQWASPDSRRPEAASPGRDVWGVGVLVAELVLPSIPYRSYRTTPTALLAAIRATDLPATTLHLAAACLVADLALRPTAAQLAALPRKAGAEAREELGRLLGLVPAPTPPPPTVGAVCGRCGEETEYSRVFLREEGGFLCDSCLAGTPPRQGVSRHWTPGEFG